MTGSPSQIEPNKPEIIKKFLAASKDGISTSWIKSFIIFHLKSFLLHHKSFIMIKKFSLSPKIAIYWAKSFLLLKELDFMEHQILLLLKSFMVLQKLNPWLKRIYYPSKNLISIIIKIIPLSATNIKIAGKNILDIP